MEEREHTAIVEKYQCPGCIHGLNVTCGQFKYGPIGAQCQAHFSGTSSAGIGTFFLGMPKGFNRIGPCTEIYLYIFPSIDMQEKQWPYNFLNVPVWKYVNEVGHIFVRGLSPRINEPFLHIIVKGDLATINCFEVTKEHINQID